MCAVGSGQLGYLNLSANDVGPIGAEHLASALSRATSLTELHLGCCAIGEAGALAIAAALAANTTLLVLDVSSNGIGNSGATELATEWCEGTLMAWYDRAAAPEQRDGDDAKQPELQRARNLWLTGNRLSYARTHARSHARTLARSHARTLAHMRARAQELL